MKEDGIPSKDVVEDTRKTSQKESRKQRKREKKEMKKLMAMILECELKKVEHKITYLSEFDKLIFLEREELKDL